MGIKKKTTLDKIVRNREYFEDFITRSVYSSNKIEGNTISYAETYALLFNDNSINIEATPREIYEAINLKYALHNILLNINKELSLKLIKETGIIINKNIKNIDGFRSVNVMIQGAEHIPPEAKYVIPLLSKLVYKDGKHRNENIYDYLARFHIEFERIHPFEDGNGRTGRLLVTKELLKRGHAPLIIPFDYRNKYFKYLAEQNIDGLSSMIKRLNTEEKERMKKFGVVL